MSEGLLTTAIDYNSICKLIKVMEESICKIKLGYASGTGFFCNINLNENKKIPVLITNNHVLREDDISPGKKIKFSTNNDKQSFEIEINEERKRYTNRKYDITIIEMKEKDCIKSDSFLNVDENIFNADCDCYYKNKPIYLLHYPKGQEMSVSPGKIKRVDAEEQLIEHLCDSGPGSAGGPLIDYNFKVIGIHKGKKKNYIFKIGGLLTGAIKEFKSQF